jgi:hypothetical protein
MAGYDDHPDDHGGDEPKKQSVLDRGRTAV